MGNPRDRCFRYGTEQEVSSVLYQRCSGTQSPGRRSAPRLEGEIPIHISSASADPKGPAKVQTRATTMYLSNTLVASSDIVSYPAATVPPPLPVSGSRSIVTGRPLPHSPPPEAHCVAHDLTFSTEVQNVFLNLRKPSTRRSYKAKWEKYEAFLLSRSLPLSSLSSIFGFMMARRAAGLSYSSLRVYLSVISANHFLIENRMVFSHPSSKTFLRGLRNLYPLTRPPPPAWDLSLVLKQLMRRPFEPLAT